MTTITIQLPDDLAGGILPAEADVVREARLLPAIDMTRTKSTAR